MACYASPSLKIIVVAAAFKLLLQMYGKKSGRRWPVENNWLNTDLIDL